jgi:hypothetical protein
VNAGLARVSQLTGCALHASTHTGLQDTMNYISKWVEKDLTSTLGLKDIDIVVI